MSPRDVEATLARALALRTAGERFTLRLAVSDVRLVGFQRAAEAAFALPPAEREAAFVQLQRLEGLRDERGERIRRLDADLARARGYAALAALAETTLVSADIKRLYVATAALDPVAQRDIATELVAPEPSATVPPALEPAAARDAPRDAVVVWCGDAHVRAAALVVHALAGLGLPLIVVANGSIAGAEAHAAFVPLADGAAALARARVVVAAHNDEPGDALALARLGVPLIVSSSSGAAEYLRDAPMYRAWVERDIAPALLAALAAPPGQVEVAVAPPPAEPPAPRTRGPRAALRLRVELGTPPAARSAEAMARQTYADVVREGEADDALYEGVVPNGALVFPDHLARMVEVAERSGAARVLAPALVADGVGGYTVELDGFALARRGAARVPLARVAVATGVLA